MLFFAPLRFSSAPRGRREEGRLDLSRLVRERVGALLRGDWASLLREARVSAKGLAKHKAAQTRAAPTDEGYLADEVCRKALAREYS